MLTAKDIRVLTGADGWRGRVALAFFLVMAVFSTVMAVLNLRMASRYGAAMDLEFPVLLRQWANDLQLATQYPGRFVYALRRIDVAAGQFGLAILSVVLFIFVRVLRQRNQRIRSLLISTGHWSDRES